MSSEDPGSRRSATDSKVSPFPVNPATTSSDSSSEALDTENKERINFFILCRIFVDIIPSDLRPELKKYVKKKIDGNEAWTTFTEKEKFHKHDICKEKFAKGDIEKWDITVLSFAMLFSSYFLLAEEKTYTAEFNGNKMKITSTSNDEHTDFGNGKIIMWDGGKKIGKNTITKIDTNEIQLQDSCGNKKDVKIYLSCEKWKHVNSLRKLRNENYGHFASSRVETKILEDVVEEIKDAYQGLKIKTDEVKKIVEGKYKVLDIMTELEELKERFKMDYYLQWETKDLVLDVLKVLQNVEIRLQDIQHLPHILQAISQRREEGDMEVRAILQSLGDVMKALQTQYEDDAKRRHEGDMEVRAILQNLGDAMKALQTQYEVILQAVSQRREEGKKRERSHSSSSHEELSCGQQQKKTRVESVVDYCKPEDVMKVIRQVSRKNLYRLQISLIQHEHEKDIIDFINEHHSYVFEKHDLTVFFWFKTCKEPSRLRSWKELIKSLNECDENVLAVKIESGKVFEDPDDIELDGINQPASPQILSHSNVSFEKLPVPNPVTKKGEDIISEAYSHLIKGYNELKFKVQKLLKEQGILFNKFRENATCHFSPAIGYVTENIMDFLQMAEQCVEFNMWHYGSLESTLELILGTDAKVKLLFNEYEEKLTNYLTTTKIIDYLKRKDKENLLTMSSKQKNIFAIHEKACWEELGVKIDINIEEESLQYILNLWKSLQKRFYLTSITVILEDIREGCIYVVLKVPKEVSNAMNTMSQKATNYFTYERIGSVWMNSKCVYHQDIHAKKDTAKAHFWLAQACESGRILEVNAILEVPDIDVNFLHIVDGKTPLMLASQEGHEEIVKVLLQRKALPNIKEDASGWSALFFAAHMGHENVIKVLLEGRADVLMTDKGGSPVLDITKKLSKAYQLIDEATKAHLCLFEACEQGDLQKVHSIVDIPTTNVDTIRSDGKTPLIVAAQCGHPDIAVCLISCEANVLISDERGYVAADYVVDGPDTWNPLREETLFTASAKGNAEVLKRILENKTDPNIEENDKEAYTPLMYACENGHHEVVELLIQYKADPNYVANDSWTALLYACINKHYTIVKTLLENNVNVNNQTADHWSPLMLVAADGNKETFELLLDYEADPELPDKKGYNPLIQAAQDGHCDIIELLVERDSLSLQIEEYRTINPDDWSALMFATKNGHTDIVKYIVNRDPDAAHRSKEDGVTLLHLASYHGHVDLVKYFLFELKLNVDAQDEDGITPLMYAAQTGNLPVVKQLRQKIANVNLIEKKIGWNAAFIAMQYKNQDVLDYLLKCDVNFDHKDHNGNNLIQLSLIFNREAFRLIKAIYEKAANQKNVSPESVPSVGEPVMSFESLLGDIPSQDYSYIEEFGKSFSRKVEVAAN